MQREATPDRKGDWIQTFRGKKFFPLDPRAEDVLLEDVAHALSNVCRFAGQCVRFYSVAEHSCHVADAIEARAPRFWYAGEGLGRRWTQEHMAATAALYALLHDASEAYLADIPRPVKAAPEMAFYKEAEARVQACCFTALVPTKAQIIDTVGLHERIAEIDNDMLHVEGEQLMPRKPEKWNLRPRVHAFEIVGELGRLTSAEAESRFLEKHARLVRVLGAEAA